MARKFLPSQDQEASRVRFDIFNINDSAKSQFVMAGATPPVNLTLFANGYQTDYNPTAAVREVTKTAIEKLASDWKLDLNIYVTTFRKQGANADCSYLSNCDTKNVRFTYDVPDSNDAQSVLEGC